METQELHRGRLIDHLQLVVRDLDASRRPLTSGADARRTLELLTAVYKSAFTGQPVMRGSIVPGDPFYSALHGGAATNCRVGRSRATAA